MKIFTGATLIDGTGGSPVDNAVLIVKEGTIAWVGPAEELHQAAEWASLVQNVDPDQVVDYTGRWIVPGLIDTHCHVSFGGTEAVLKVIKTTDRDTLLIKAVENARILLQSGVTTVRDLGGYEGIDLAIKSAVQTGVIPGPRMQVAGTLLTMTGGHGYFFGLEVDGPEEVRKAARQQLKHGADLVKVMASGGTATPGQDIMAGQFTVEEIAAATSEAHRRGKKVAAHAHGPLSIVEASRAGVDSIEHGSFLTSQAAEIMVKNNTTLVPTLTTWAHELQHLRQAGAGPEVIDALLRKRERRFQAVAVARELGVNIALGTDSGGNEYAPHDGSIYTELEQMVEFGFTAGEAIQSATSWAADLMGISNITGTLTAQRAADFLVLQRDPLESISNVRSLLAVYQAGESVAAP